MCIGMFLQFDCRVEVLNVLCTTVNFLAAGMPCWRSADELFKLMTSTELRAAANGEDGVVCVWEFHDAFYAEISTPLQMVS